MGVGKWSDPGVQQKKEMYLIFSMENDHMHICLPYSVPVNTYCPGAIINCTPSSLKSAHVWMINYTVTLLINKQIEHMVTLMVLESQADLTKPPAFVPDLETDAVRWQRYHPFTEI